MKLIAEFFNNILIKPTTLFYFNIFFLKNSVYFNMKYLLYICMHLNIRKHLTAKILKFRYKFYNNFLLYFMYFNLILQILTFLLFI